MNDNIITNDCKDTESGSIPDSWTIIKLRKVFEFSKKPKSLDIASFDHIPFIPMEYIPEEEIYVSKNELKKPSEIKSGTFFFKGDLLVAKITPSFENGKQCIVKDIPQDFGYATTEIWPIHKTGKSDILFLFYYLKKHDIRINIASKMEGSTGRQRVPRHVLANLEIPLPPLPEQRKIAAVLSTVQNAKEKTEEVIKATKELKRSMMKHLFTYGPVSVEEAENVPLKETEIGMVPEGWDVVRLEDMTKTYSGGTPNRSNLDYWNGSIPWAKSGELNDSFIYEVEERISEKGLKNSSAKFVEPETLLIAMYGATAGKVGLAKSSFTINQAICAVEKNDYFYTQFYFYYLMTVRNKLLAERFGGAQPNLNQQIIKNIKIPLPPFPEQKKIASVLSALDDKIQTEQNKRKILEDLFRTLLHNLMTAKLRVNQLNLGERV